MSGFPNTHLTVGGNDPFLPNLIQAINHATSISIAAAFIRQSGLNLIFDALDDALLRGAELRILTGDYMGITQPSALRNLMLLGGRGAKLKVFESKNNQSFHMKAYIFIENELDESQSGLAFIGSSNISQSALQSGLEWNLTVDRASTPEKFEAVYQHYNLLFDNERCVPLAHSWIDAYEKRIPQTTTAKVIVDNEDDEFEPIPTPNIIQAQALTKLYRSRQDGYKRGLVVMATGTGKTWLSAFDFLNMSAKSILFVAHREEILDQAEKTFIRIFPNARIGRYSASNKDSDVDMLFASIQTIGKQAYLDQFSKNKFEYIVVDEFHHAAANSYRKLLNYFKPKFMLGLTATPERTDQADILSLCDNNLVFSYGMFEGITADVLCPFDYRGVADNVDYSEITWRNNKFDPHQLENKLATISRAKHNLKTWKKLKQKRTLAFCISTKHADFMANYFTQHGVKALSVHSKAKTPRHVALRHLDAGIVDIIFSVDLFNEGVDLPSIDTVMMLRPTESKIVFLQQLGRGLRKSNEKQKLIILDFIGNHISFFRKVDALFNLGVTNAKRKTFLKQLKEQSLALPKGCFINFELAVIDILQQLIATNIDTQIEIFEGLTQSLGRRPTLSEFYYGGGSVERVRNEYGSWFVFVEVQNGLSLPESKVVKEHQLFLTEVEVTNLTKSFKLILLEAFLELDGLLGAIAIQELCNKSIDVLQRYPKLIVDLREDLRASFSNDNIDVKEWSKYWKQNPIKAWTGGNSQNKVTYFSTHSGKFGCTFKVTFDNAETLSQLLQELVDYRFIQYDNRLANRQQDSASTPHNIVQFIRKNMSEIPYFNDLKIACGHFKTSTHENAEQVALPISYGNLNPEKNFIAKATGNSMNGGLKPIKEGDLLLFERVSSQTSGIGSLNHKTVAIERYEATGDDQYLLRTVEKITHQQYELVAQNPDYKNIQTEEDMHAIAVLKAIVEHQDIFIHRQFMRAEIPELFGLEFNKAVWESGHITPKNRDEQFLLVTLNKQGKIQAHQYHDKFVDAKTFKWQSQASTTIKSKKGQAILHHEKVHLFVRKNKLENKKAAPFYYLGRVDYQSHSGEKPLDVTWQLQVPLPKGLFEHFSF
jgi:superfamily II DNA or RNA helicase/HKD family nuclease/SOS-response transcriptional repressor LexA